MTGNAGVESLSERPARNRSVRRRRSGPDGRCIDPSTGPAGEPKTTPLRPKLSPHIRSRLQARRNRARETLTALIASPETPILNIVGGWRGISDAIGPNLLFLVVYLINADLVWATMTALAMSLVLTLARSIARQPVGPAIGGLILVALSGLMAVMGGDGGDVFLPDLIQTAVVSAILLFSLAVRRPLLGMILGPVVSGPHWRTNKTLLRGYDWATALMAAAAATRSLTKLPFYFADDVVALGIIDLLTGVPLAIATTYFQLRVLRRAYAAAGPTARTVLRDRVDEHSGGGR